MESSGDYYIFPEDVLSSRVTSLAQSSSYALLRNVAWAETTRRGHRFIYRYSSLLPEDETSIDRLKDVVLRSRLWLSSPEDFNDPFDSKAQAVYEPDTRKRRAKIEQLVRTHAPHLSWSEKREKINQMMARTPSQWHVESAQILEKNSTSLGISCFTDDPRNLLMWSHYARHHRGICLQFEVVRDINVFARAQAVEYTNDYPLFNIFTFTMDDLSRLMLSKFKDWEYERERRIVCPDGAHKWLRFSPNALTGVILGTKAGDKSLSTIKQVLAERSDLQLPRINLYQAHQHASSYRLRIRRIG